MRPTLGCVLLIVTWIAACHHGGGGGATADHPHATTGAIAGLARDHDSGEPVAFAQVHIRPDGEFKPFDTTSTKEGIYGVDHLQPGRYSLSATFGGQPIEISNIDVKVNEATIVDLIFTLGRVDPIHIDFSDPKIGMIDRYHPKVLSMQLSIIEGTVNDLTTRQRVPGAVVTVVGSDTVTFQTVTDDQGRFRVEAPPSTFVVSAYYSVGGRAQIEVRRSDIAVTAGEAVVVPLWIELAK